MFLQRQSFILIAALTGCLAVSIIGYLSITNNFGARNKPGPVLSNIPKRAKSAPGGSRFLADSSKLSSEQREAAIVEEISRGNIPDYLRQMHTVTFRTKLKDGKYHRVDINVMPDYLAVGSDKDFVRMPMSPLSAQKIADQYNLVLPTAKLVDEIYKSASLKYSPNPLPPGKQMVSSDYYKKHNQLIEKQRKGRRLGQLAGGHKKDIVLTNRLKSRPGKVAIYGWHRSGGKVIQPLSLVHGNYYADYSHGIRLIDPWIKVDGKRRHISTVQNNQFLAPLVSGEGKLLASRAYSSAPTSLAKLKKKKSGANRLVSVRTNKKNKARKRT